MNSITIVSIVVVAVLTVVIFALIWVAYASCLRSYRMEIDQGLHDDDIQTQSKRKWGLVGVITSYLALFALLGLLITGIVYKARGENFVINNHTALVIESGSMSKYFDNSLAAKYDYDTSLQFDIGDICVFDTDFVLNEGEVYGYKVSDIVITHRLVTIQDGYCYFRGDANPSQDALAVKPEQVVYHYTGHHVPVIGAFILYAKSPFGIWSLAGIVGLTVGSGVICHRIEKIDEERRKQLGGGYEE